MIKVSEYDLALTGCTVNLPESIDYPKMNLELMKNGEEAKKYIHSALARISGLKETTYFVMDTGSIQGLVEVLFTVDGKCKILFWIRNSA